MTTVSWSSVCDHSSDAGFRAWGSEVGVKLALAGMVQTADTGQINWATVVRPGAGAVGGYEIWRNPNSSIYIKLEYGAGGLNTIPAMWVTVGTGSNGSGTITDAAGIISTRVKGDNQNTVGSAVIAYPSYIAVGNDYVNMIIKAGAISTAPNTGPVFFVAISKTVDSAGAANAEGLHIHYCANNTQLLMHSVRRLTPAVVYAPTAFYTVMPHDLTVTTIPITGDLQAYHCFGAFPDVRPSIGTCCYRLSEVTAFNTFSLPLVGSTPRTYLALPKMPPSPTGPNNQVNYGIAMLYE